MKGQLLPVKLLIGVPLRPCIINKLLHQYPYLASGPGSKTLNGKIDPFSAINSSACFVRQKKKADPNDPLYDYDPRHMHLRAETNRGNIEHTYTILIVHNFILL
jgi:hypothetical protein